MIDGILNAFGAWLKSTIIGEIFKDLNGEALVFLAIGLLGLVILIISVLLDGLFEAFNFGDGPLSLTTLSAFMTMFGFGALISSSSGLSGGLSSLVGLGIGVLGGLLSYWLTRFIKRSEGGSSIEESEFDGREATVTLAIPLNGLGSITLVASGERYHVSAKANEPIAQGEKVVIQTMISSTSALVKKIDENIVKS